MESRREIMTAIIRDKQCPSRMGLYEHYWGETIPRWVRDGAAPEGMDPVAHFNYDLRQMGGWFDTQAIRGQDIPVEETDQTRVSINGWGATMRNWKHKSGTPEHIGFDLVSEEIWRKKYREQLLTLDPLRLGDLDRLREDYRRFMAEDRFNVWSQLFIFEIMRVSMGDVVMLESMCLNPEWITDFCTVVTDFIIRHCEYLFREVGIPDGYWMYEDMGFTRAPFISVDMYRELIFPHHRRFADFIHSYNIPFIMHSCGKIREFLPYLLDAGVDCLQVLEAKAGQDVREFAQATGNKMAFMGNINIVPIETNDHAIIDAEIVPKLKDISKYKIPYVFHTDHSIPQTVTADTYRYVLELYDRYKWY